jgi:hypothetical protein
VETGTIMQPVHPGEILLEEFLKPLEVSQYRPQRRLASRLGGSTRSCTASGGSARTQRFVWLAISGPLSGSG